MLMSANSTVYNLVFHSTKEKWRAAAVNSFSLSTVKSWWQNLKKMLFMSVYRDECFCLQATYLPILTKITRIIFITTVIIIFNTFMEQLSTMQWHIWFLMFILSLDSLHRLNTHKWLRCSLYDTLHSASLKHEAMILNKTWHTNKSKVYLF